MRQLTALLLLASGCGEIVGASSADTGGVDPGADACRQVAREPLAADERAPDGRTPAEIAALIAGTHAAVLTYRDLTPTGARLELVATGATARLRFEGADCAGEEGVFTPAKLHLRTDDGRFDEIASALVRSGPGITDLQVDLAPPLQGSWESRPGDPAIAGFRLTAVLGAGRVERGGITLLPREAHELQPYALEVGTLAPDWSDCWIEPAMRAFAGPGARSCGAQRHDPGEPYVDTSVDDCTAAAFAAGVPFFGYRHGVGTDSHFAQGVASDGTRLAWFAYDSCPTGCGLGDPHLYRMDCTDPAVEDGRLGCTTGERQQICP